MLDELMDRTFDVHTETNLLTLYDPAQLAHRIEESEDWWADDAVLLGEAGKGHVLPFRPDGDGVFRLQLTVEAPTADVDATYWLAVASGRLCLTGAEWLPADGDEGPGEKSLESFPLPNGRYQVALSRPASEDVEAPDFVLSVQPLAEGAQSPAPPAALEALAPAQHPLPEDQDPEQTAQAEALMRKALLEEQDPAQRLALVDEALGIDPRHYEGLLLRSALREDQEDLEGALADAVRASCVAPTDGHAWLSRASCLLRMERAEEALPAARRATELGASVADAWDMLGDVLHALEHTDPAHGCWKKAVQLDHPAAAAIKAKMRRAQ